VLALAPRVARGATCDRDADYDVTVDGGTVTVCTRSSSRQCGAAIDLLRQSESDGTAVVVAASPCSAAGCYVDACVPPGQYRYGYAKAFDCSEGECGAVGLFEEVSVTAALPASCALTSPTPAPAAEVPPWGTPAPGTHPLRLFTCNAGTCSIAPRAGAVPRWLDGLVVCVGLAIAARRARRRARRRAPLPTL